MPTPCVAGKPCMARMFVSHGWPAARPSGSELSSSPSFAKALDGIRTAAMRATAAMAFMPLLQLARPAGSRSAHRARDAQRVGLGDLRLEAQEQVAAPPQQRVRREPRRVALHLSIAIPVHEDVRLARDPDAALGVHGHRLGGSPL